MNEKGVISERLKGEPKLGLPLVRMTTETYGERLAPRSRVDYSKLVTVEHNVKVVFIGSIYGDDDDDLVTDAVNTCWARENPFKRHRPKAGGKGKGKERLQGKKRSCEEVEI